MSARSTNLNIRGADILLPTVRPCIIEDNNKLHGLLNNRELLDDLMPGVCAHLAHEASIAFWKNELASQDSLQFVVCKEASIVGAARIEKGELAYFIDRQHRGEGLATLLISFICCEFLSRNKKHSILALIHRSNVASIRAVERCGFIFRGISYIYRDSGVIEYRLRNPG